MPPTPGGEWAVARFRIDHMYSNDTHRRVIDPAQQYERFYFVLNGDLTPESFIELAWVVVWRGQDAQPPSAPENCAIERDGAKARLKWSPSKDNLMVSHYEVLRKDGENWKRVTIATMPALDLPAGPLPAGEYAVRAVDVAGNRSGLSEPAR